MIKLVAVKKLRYPRGAEGKEYNPGDAFEALSERDAKALKLVRAAKDAPAEPARRTFPKTPVETAAMKAETSETVTTTDTPSRYRRRDMRSED